MKAHAKRTLFFTGGVIALILAFIGIFLPVMPTTPFVILAAWCFSKSSEKIHQYLLNHGIFGPLIRDWEEKGAISRRAKILASLGMLTALIFPLFVVNLHTGVRAGVVSIMAVLAVFIWTRPE